MAEVRAATRIGGHLVAESLRCLGAETVFGIPGYHALPMWEGLGARGLRTLGFRQELNAAFAADGCARVTGKPAPLLVSTGPGAFMTIGALHEAFTAFVPVVVVASQIERDAIGRGLGLLHETPDQMASFAPLVKWSSRAETAAEIPDVLADAWRRAATAPSGPVYVEIPFDVLRAETTHEVGELEGAPLPVHTPNADDLDRAAALLARAQRPLLVAGGGSVRSGAREEILALAQRLGAPVATTYTGKGAVPENHPLALGSAWDDAAFRAVVFASDVVLVVGSWLGYEYADAFAGMDGTVIQIDAEPSRIGLAVPALGLAGDAAPTLRSLLERVQPRAQEDGAAHAAATRERIDRSNEGVVLDLLRTIEGVFPRVAAASWDSTILAYAACWYLRAPGHRCFLYPSGSSTLGYAFPAALGAAAARPGARVLAIAGDGGFQYGIAELATAMQHGLPVALLVVDDQGYGILREYQDAAGFSRTGVDLDHPDFERLFAAYGVPARRTTIAGIRGDLEWALEQAGPAAVLLETVLTLPTPSS